MPLVKEIKMIKYKQIFLGDVRHGIARPLAVVDCFPNELANLKGIRFETARDSVDYMYAAAIELEDGQQFGLRNYYRGPYPGRIEILGDEKSPNSVIDANTVLEVLALPKEKILWRLPN
jgi:hypothetical protein